MEFDKPLTQSTSLPTKTKELNDVIFDVLVTLARQLDSEDLVNKITSSFGQYFLPNTNTDLSRWVMDFLLQVVGEDTNTVRVLKACNQSVLAPAVLRLKSVVGSYFPYKDVRGGWRLLIKINQDEVIIVHRRWEQSFVQGDFNFKWELEMVFDRQLKDLVQCKVRITDVKFNNDSIKPNAMKVMKGFMI